MASCTLEKALEKASGETIARLRSLGIAEVRKLAEAKFQNRFRVLSWWPFIGRGSVMKDRVLTHGDIEVLFDKALRA